MIQENKKLSKAVNLFERKNLWLNLLRIMFPQILIALMTGFYVFIDQILMNVIIPHDGVHDNAGIWDANTYNKAKEIWSKVFPNTEIYTASDVIHNATAISMPIIMILSAISLWFAMGSSILFGQAIGRHDTKGASYIWCSSLRLATWSTLVFTIIIAAIVHVWLVNTSGSNVTVDSSKPVGSFLKIFHTNVVNYAFSLVLPIILANFLQTFILVSNFCLSSEGRQSIVLLITFCGNILNILLDFVFMYFAKLGMLGAGIGVVISYLFTCSLLFVYLWKLNKDELTSLTLDIFSGIKIDLAVSISTITVGLSSLLRNLSVAFAALLYQTLLLQTTQAIGLHSENYWLNFSGATMPIYNLVFATLLGLLRSMRMLFSYNLASGNFDRIRKSYWIGILYSVIYAIIIFGILSIRQVGLFFLHDCFDINITSPSDVQNALLYLRFVLSNMIWFGFIMSGMIFFQASGRIIWASIVSIMSGIGFAVIVFFINKSLAITFKNEEIYLSSWLITSALSGISICSFTSFYIHHYLKPGFQIHDYGQKMMVKIQNWIKYQNEKKIKIVSQE